MPRQVRIEYPSAIYHLASRGDRPEKISLDDADRQDFIKALAEACQKTAWQDADLASRRKHDPDKLEIAVRLRRETTLT
jgi:hypothetical protein